MNQATAALMASAIPTLLLAGFLSSALTNHVHELGAGTRWAYLGEVVLAVVGTYLAVVGGGREEGWTGSSSAHDAATYAIWTSCAITALFVVVVAALGVGLIKSRSGADATNETPRST